METDEIYDDKTVFARDALLGIKYLSKKDRVITPVRIEDDRVLVKVELINKLVPIPMTYPLRVLHEEGMIAPVKRKRKVSGASNNDVMTKEDMAYEQSNNRDPASSNIIDDVIKQELKNLMEERETAIANPDRFIEGQQKDMRKEFKEEVKDVFTADDNEDMQEELIDNEVDLVPEAKIKEEFISEVNKLSDTLKHDDSIDGGNTPDEVTLSISDTWRVRRRRGSVIQKIKDYLAEHTVCSRKDFGKWMREEIFKELEPSKIAGRISIAVYQLKEDGVIRVEDGMIFYLQK